MVLCFYVMGFELLPGRCKKKSLFLVTVEVKEHYQITCTLKYNFHKIHIGNKWTKSTVFFMNWNHLIVECIDYINNAIVYLKILLELYVAGNKSMPVKDYPRPGQLQYSNNSTIEPQRVSFSGQTALKTTGENRGTPTLGHLSCPAPPSRFLFPFIATMPLFKNQYDFSRKDQPQCSYFFLLYHH